MLSCCYQPPTHDMPCSKTYRSSFRPRITSTYATRPSSVPNRRFRFYGETLLPTHTECKIGNSMMKSVRVTIPPPFSGTGADGMGALIAKDNELSMTIISTTGVF